MTTFFTATQTCAVCGASVSCAMLGSSSAFGSPDLDLRPAEMQRSTMSVWLQECPRCRYVSEDIEVASANAQAILASDPYQQLVADTKVPELARRFARQALLNASDREQAGRALLHAAWVCDDEGAVQDAIRYRCQAADVLGALQPFDDTNEGASLGAVLVDVLRRVQRFSEAKALSATLLALNSVSSHEPLAQVLGYQIQRCDAGDAECHTMDDAVQDFL